MHKGILYLCMVSLLVTLGMAGIMDHDEQDTNENLQPNIKKEIPHEGVKVYFIQLTSGEATLIELENEETILVDTGSSFSEKELLAFLHNQDLLYLDHLMITNPQDEHFGNFKTVYDQFEPEHIYYPHYMDDTFEHVKTKDDTTLHPLQKGDQFDVSEDARFHVLHPDKRLSMKTKDNSLVFQFIHDEQRFLFMSDCTRATEQYLLKDYDLHSEVLKVGDFGSMEGSGEQFLEEVDAHIAIIFYRPQHYLEPEVLERLKETWMDVYPLKEHGHVLIVSQGVHYDVFVLPSKQDSLK